MQTLNVFRAVSVLGQTHTRRTSEFTLPSVYHPGHEITVRRLDENSRPVSQSDIHFLMHAHVAPGHSATMRNHTGKPCNRFVVYMSAEPKPVDVFDSLIDRPASR